MNFWTPSELRLWRTGMLLLTKSKGHMSNSTSSGFQNLHISICQSQILCIKSRWGTLYTVAFCLPVYVHLKSISKHSGPVRGRKCQLTWSARGYLSSELPPPKKQAAAAVQCLTATLARKWTHVQIDFDDNYLRCTCHVRVWNRRRATVFALSTWQEMTDCFS